MSEVEIDNPCYAHASIRVHLHHRALVAARHDSKQAMIISRRGGRNRAFFFFLDQFITSSRMLGWRQKPRYKRLRVPTVLDG